VLGIKGKVESLMYWADINVSRGTSSPFELSPIKAVAAKLQKVSLELADVKGVKTWDIW
jgi:hypothetical protein